MECPKPIIICRYWILFSLYFLSIQPVIANDVSSEKLLSTKLYRETTTTYYLLYPNCWPILGNLKRLLDLYPEQDAENLDLYVSLSIAKIQCELSQPQASIKKIEDVLADLVSKAESIRVEAMSKGAVSLPIVASTSYLTGLTNRIRQNQVAKFISGSHVLLSDFYKTGIQWYGPESTRRVDVPQPCYGLDWFDDDDNPTFSDYLEAMICDGEITKRDYRRASREFIRKYENTPFSAVPSEAGEYVAFVSFDGAYFKYNMGDELSFVTSKGIDYVSEGAYWLVEDAEGALASLSALINAISQIKDLELDFDVSESEEYQESQLLREYIDRGLISPVNGRRQFNGERYRGFKISQLDVIREYMPRLVQGRGPPLDDGLEFPYTRFWIPVKECAGPSIIEEVEAGIPINLYMFPLC